jgi:Domain of unknown function (DUF3391)
MPHTIAIEDLRVGMFIQLESGWMSHPFGRSCFCIDKLAQIVTLRAMGLNHVLWMPERSQPQAVTALHFALDLALAA